jgi:transcriptional regulator with XRE-family HTH domain
MTDTPSDLVAARIQTARRLRGWTAKDLAARCADLGDPQLTAAVIANIETGRRDSNGQRRREVTIDELFAIARALDIEPASLLALTPNDEFMSNLGGRSMARVEWTRLSGNDVEAVLAILLCREYPSGTRVKPSRGDGGIDFWVPSDDAAEIFQIKGFTGNIGSTRRRQIESSWKRMLSYTQQNSIPVSGWTLVTPENPTNEQLRWFEEMIRYARFPCRWHGLDFVDSLVSKYPEVVDYYLRDGKDRLEATIQRLLSIAQTKNLSVPAQSMESLNELHRALNQFDPHFRYDFSVEAVNAAGVCQPAPLAPGTVAVVQWSDGERCITYRIVARFNEAIKERPVPGSMTLVAPTGSLQHEQFEDWERFGTPLTDFPAKNVRWDLPGGFGGSYEDATVSILSAKPEPGSPNEAITLRILEPDGATAASLDFITEEVSAGLDQHGVRHAGHDKEAGLVRYELRMKRDSATDKVAANLRITAEEATGRIPKDMIPGLRFLAEVRPPRRIQISVRNGPPVAPPLPIEDELISIEQGTLWLLMCESLSEIQNHIIERFKFPNMTKYHSVDPIEDIEGWYQAARLLRGEVLHGTWSSVDMHLNPGQDIPSDIPQAIFSNYYATRIGTRTYQIGIAAVQVASVQVDETRPTTAHEDHLDVRLVPSDDNTMTIRMASGPLAIGETRPLFVAEVPKSVPSSS